MREHSELSRLSLYLRDPYSRTTRERRQVGGNLRREDRRISERRRGGGSLYARK